MPTVLSFAKINLGLAIGPARADGFHELRTVYQTIGLHDVVSVRVQKGKGVAILSDDPRVPRDETNTCYRIVDRTLEALQTSAKVTIKIEKRLPIQGGLGGASANAVSALIGLERALRKSLRPSERMAIAADVGSDLPQFLVGGTSLGIERGQVVFPLPDLPAMPCVVATPEVGVSTPKAFADWDVLMREAKGGGTEDELTAPTPSNRIERFGYALSAWLSDASGASARGRSRAESPLLDLVRTGIENDFERVVFPQYPELRDIKTTLECAGAVYASLSGSGSALYGLFRKHAEAERAARALRKDGIPAQLTSTMTRRQYWQRIRVSGF